MGNSRSIRYVINLLAHKFLGVLKFASSYKMEVEKMDKSQTYPDFFKVFLPEDSLGKMLIPAAFIACLDKKLPGKTILRNRLGSLWQVKVIYTKNNVFFEDGWVNFVKDNSLAFGDFLVFRYNGDRIFHFRIYEINPREKKELLREVGVRRRMLGHLKALADCLMIRMKRRRERNKLVRMMTMATTMTTVPKKMRRNQNLELTRKLLEARLNPVVEAAERKVYLI